MPEPKNPMITSGLTVVAILTAFFAGGTIGFNIGKNQADLLIKHHETANKELERDLATKTATETKLQAELDKAIADGMKQVRQDGMLHKDSGRPNGGSEVEKTNGAKENVKIDKLQIKAGSTGETVFGFRISVFAILFDGDPLRHKPSFVISGEIPENQITRTVVDVGDLVMYEHGGRKYSILLDSADTFYASFTIIEVK